MATAPDNGTQQLANKQQNGYEWIDLTDPSPAQLNQIAEQYALHDASIEDMLAVDHLPKYERLKQYTFIILRYYAAEKDNYADTVEELTNKIALVIGQGFIITIHRHAWEPLSMIYERKVKRQECESPEQALVEVVRAVLESYEAPAHKLNHTIDLYEEQVFLKHRKAPMLKGLYYIKRKVDVIRRLLILSYEVVDKIDPPQESNALTRDIRDLHIKQHSVYDALAENISQLLAIYFNVSAQRTNEIIRILTIFSVFFLPLTFIVGIYGMNFRFMPELNWKAGYPAAIGLMVLVTAAIYYWFRRNNWL
ncbi:CorA family divalent cation transporter [Paraflavitalea pollutisoli]|uniref:magnesium transporter CorA family protein n=1 Tax=Paraflavitalea pollutisoli TaxID=3034143 RepID=UPI0023ED555C|nr:CorA family divalent cation transporter [Paraflavitalea sp. H1-2-19X]